MQSLLDSFQDNPTHLRVCIQYEVLQKKSIFDAYKTFCNTFGDDAMEYKEFDHWYWRFHNGMVELDYDRSEERKSVEIGDLPVEILTSIMKKLDVESRITTRQVCKPLRNIINTIKSTIKSVDVDLTRDAISIKCDDKTTVIGLHDIRGEGFTRRMKLIIAAKEFKTQLSQAYFQFDRLTMKLKMKSLEDNTFLSNIKNCPYYVKHFEFQTSQQSHAVSMVSAMEPGRLESIELSSTESWYYVEEGLMRLEQVKRAKCVNIVKLGLCLPSDVQSFYSFEEFKIRLDFISMDAFVRLIENCRSFPSFKTCLLYTFQLFDPAEIEAALGEVISADGKIVERVPDTDDFLEMTFSQKYSITVERSRVTNPEIMNFMWNFHDDLF